MFLVFPQFLALSSDKMRQKHICCASNGFAIRLKKKNILALFFFHFYDLSFRGMRLSLSLRVRRLDKKKTLEKCR